MSIGNWYRVGSVALVNGSVNAVGTGTFWSTQCNPGDRFTVDGENWYEVATITDDTHLTIQSVGGSGGYAGTTGSNLSYAIDRNFTNTLTANIAAQTAALLSQFQTSTNGPLSGLFGNGSAATPGIAFLNEASTGFFKPATGAAALAVQGAEFLRAVGTAAGVPAKLGLGTTAPTQALDLVTSNNALFGARVLNSSAGTAARAALQISNGTQLLNAGVNGTGFTTTGVLAASRGFVEAPTGLDFASGVTMGTAFSWGIGASYASQMTLDSSGNLALATGTITATAGNVLITAGKLGIGMTPSNMVDIVKTQNAATTFSMLNASTGTGAYSAISLTNGTHNFSIYQTGTSYTASGLAAQDGAGLVGGGAGGLAIGTAGAYPLRFGVNNAEAARFDGSGRFGLGVTPSAWGSANSIDIGSLGSIFSTVGVGLATNGYYNGSTWVGKSSGNFAQYQHNGGVHQWWNASSVSAGTAFSPTQVMTLDTIGNLLVGTNSGSCHSFIKAVGQGALVHGTGSSTTGANSTLTYAAGSQVGNASANVFFVGYNTSTSRSINACGTVNASGADYAEYRKLIPALYGAVAKGALLGYDANGLMTPVYADVVGRVLPKSTNPSYVGGDTWGTEAAVIAAHGIEAPGQEPPAVLEPVAPVVANPGEGPTEEQVAYVAAYAQFQADMAAYQTRLAVFNAALEAERLKYDRIALCGVVPVNLPGVTVTPADIGKYLVPCAASDGTITATLVAKADLTLGQYIDSFGTIEKIDADGRPLVNVKNG